VASYRCKLPDDGSLAENVGANWEYVVIIIGKDTISIMQGIYTYIPETNHVPKEYNFAAILSLLFMVPISQLVRCL
jgi:hypothetical protein